MAHHTTRRAFLGAVGAAGGASVACSSGLTGGPPAPALSHEPIPLDEPLAVEDIPTPALLIDVATMELNLAKMAAHAEKQGIEDIPTPALLIDVATMELNLAKMAAHAEKQGISLRPHTKTHPCWLSARWRWERSAFAAPRSAKRRSWSKPASTRS